MSETKNFYRVLAYFKKNKEATRYDISSNLNLSKACTNTIIRRMRRLNIVSTQPILLDMRKVTYRWIE